MTAYARQRITRTDAAAISRRQRAKKLATWWKKAGYNILSFTEKSKERK